MSTLLADHCTQWTNGSECGNTTNVRPYLTGAACHACAPAHDNPPHATCPVCGTYLDPAATAGHDGTPNVFDTHPGCQRRTSGRPA